METQIEDYFQNRSEKHLAAVSVEEDYILMWIDTEPDIVSKVRDDMYELEPEDTANTRKALLYLLGIDNLLEYQQTKKWKLEIHIDNLLAFNILTRYLFAWKKNNWVTSKKRPVNNKIFLNQLANRLEECGELVTIKNFSLNYAKWDTALKNVKNKKQIIII
jgi:hypothetical protein